MIQDFAFLKRIYNALDPFRPLPAGDPASVDCTEVGCRVNTVRIRKFDKPKTLERRKGIASLHTRKILKQILR